MMFQWRGKVLVVNFELLDNPVRALPGRNPSIDENST
jgi:hypothetical protein